MSERSYAEAHKTGSIHTARLISAQLQPIREHLYGLRNCTDEEILLKLADLMVELRAAMDYIDALAHVKPNHKE